MNRHKRKNEYEQHRRSMPDFDLIEKKMYFKREERSGKSFIDGFHGYKLVYYFRNLERSKTVREFLTSKQESKKLN